jgi:hypothetical protein
MSAADTLRGVTSSVMGIDLHPVAVTLARVTYLLAIGLDRIRERDSGESITFPVYLGDSIQWLRDESLMSHGVLRVPVHEEGTLLETHLEFPSRLLKDPGRFDQFVSELASKASSRVKGSAVPKLTSVFSRFAIPVNEQEIIERTFSDLCRLHDTDQDHIWGYYIRQATRPFWLSQPENAVDVLISNPPWLSKRFMPRRMQERFKAMAQERGLWVGGRNAPQQDLAGLFVARSIELYLKKHGDFAFVTPLAALEGESYGPFREGVFASTKVRTDVAFRESWDIRNVRSQPAFFPMPAAVVFGQSVEETERRPLPIQAEAWAGSLPEGHLSLERAMEFLSISPVQLVRRGEGTYSQYRERFFNGATLFPRLLILVEENPTNDPIGFGVGVTPVRSSRSAQEHEPWKSLPSLEGAVEGDFVHRVFTGASLLPYRCLPPSLAVIGWNRGTLLDASKPALDSFPHLKTWLTNAEAVWTANRTDNTTFSLSERFDYMRALSSQFPIAPHRVAYTMAGSRLAAARIEDGHGIIEQSLLWCVAQDESEAHFLNAILNSRILTDLVAAYQTVGQFGRRHFTKHVFEIDIPLYDSDSSLHRELSIAGKEAEFEAAEVHLPDNISTTRGRRIIREHLQLKDTQPRIELLVHKLLRKGDVGGH